jgi:hypothetical protein
MRQSTLRSVLLSTWGGGFVACIVGFLLIPVLRPAAASSSEAFDALKSVTGVWLPVLGCWAAFWFGNETERHKSRARILDNEHAWTAIAIGVCYATVVLGVLLWSAYGINYAGVDYRGPDLACDLRFKEQVSQVVEWASLLSPVGAAPTIWLSGRAPQDQ